MPGAGRRSPVPSQPQRDRVLLIDEDLPRRLATELCCRGRFSTTIAALNFGGSKDPKLLADLEQLGLVLAWVLVTGDDAMPWEHGRVIRATGATVATISPRRPEGVTEAAWRRDVAHRWAHAIQQQEPGTVRRYSLTGSRPWVPRRRHLSLAGG